MTTPKLTLPIQIGKKYVRRDGTVVTARAPYKGFDTTCFYVGTKSHAECQGGLHVWSNGRVSRDHDLELDYDLVADFVQKSQKKARTSAVKPVAQEEKMYTLEQCLKAIDHATGYTLQGYRATIQKQLDKFTDPEYIEYLRLKDKFENN